MEQMRQFIEKYNSSFDIDSSDWFKSAPTTDIFIRAEKNEKNKIKTLSMFYEKKGLNLKYNTTNFEKVKIPNEERNDIKPNKVVEIYNNCKREFQYDNNLENFYFDGNISENNYDYSNYIIQVQNNNILFNNNNYRPNKNYNYNENNNFNNYNYNIGNNNNYNINNNNSSYGGQLPNNFNNNVNNFVSRRAHDIRDRNGKIIGRVDANGDIREENGNIIGKFDDNGDIRGENENIIWKN